MRSGCYRCAAGVGDIQTKELTRILTHSPGCGAISCAHSACRCQQARRMVGMQPFGLSLPVLPWHKTAGSIWIPT